jgi:hypothetical protein
LAALGFLFVCLFFNSGHIYQSDALPLEQRPQSLPSCFLASVIFQLEFHGFAREANLRPHDSYLCYASQIAETTGPLHHTCFVGWDGGLTNFLPRLTWNHDPPNLCLWSSLDFRHVPPWPAEG